MLTLVSDKRKKLPLKKHFEFTCRTFSILLSFLSFREERVIMELWLGGSIVFVSIAFVIKKMFIRKPNLVLKTEEEFVFISGCDSGIGSYCAQLFDALGFNVFAGCLFPDGEGAQKLAQLCSDRLCILKLDVTDETNIQQLTKTLETKVKDKGLWGLINNAGVLCYGEFEWLTWSQCDAQVQVNLVGTIRLTRALLPSIRQRRGRILTMSSINGVIAYPAQAVYCATKFGLEGFCGSLRLEMMKHSVSISTLQLGDFARLTNIMSAHQKQVKEMWEGMSETQQRTQGDYFRRFHQVTQDRFGLTSPKSLRNSQLDHDLRHFILSPYPLSRYLCASFIHRCLYKLLLLLPWSVSDRFIQFIFDKIFSWKQD